MKLKNIATRKIRRELARREAGAGRLQKQHAKLAKRIAGIEAELAELGVDGAPARQSPKPGRKPGRPKGSKNRRLGRKPPKNKLGLPAALAAAVKPGAIVSPAKAAGLVKARGYRTTDKTFGHTVSKILSTHKGFRRKGRGRYERVAG